MRQPILPLTFTSQALRRAGQAAVVGLVVAGLFVGAGSDAVPMWLVPFIPFARNGALLAIRRPRTPIGSILRASEDRGCRPWQPR